jgi:glycosyltransferase involved in cell wall biosynthesis
MLLRAPRSLYAAFDRFPTRKGAATHIAQFAPCLFDYAGGGLLYVLGDDSLPVHQVEGDVEILRFAQPVENFLDRAVAYGICLERVLDQAAPTLRIAHFRDPWSGVPILLRARSYATVFEVNALPSIELPHAFPGVAPRTLDKIRASEAFCLERCDAVITPSQTTRALLLSRGVAAEKISVVPNGAEIVAAPPRPAGAAQKYLIYFGALQSWQGVDTLLRAFARLADLDDLQLVVCGSQRSREARRCERFASRLGLDARMQWQWALSAAELAPWVANAALSLAPLRECARNVSQGCAPLKILESMAAGVAVVASDLPPVRELVRDGIEGRLVAPDRPAELARAIRVLMAYPEQRRALGARARERIAAEFTWAQSLEKLREVYRRVDPAHNGNEPFRRAFPS